MLNRFLVVFLFATCALAEVRISLDSKELDGTWTLENQNKSIRTNGRVPGGVYTDLEATGVLKTPVFYRFNDHEYRWVSLDNWTYSRSFDIPTEILGKKAVNLVLHGVDTIGQIFLNGQLLGSVDNMYIRYVFPIKNIAQEKNNTLEVRLQSAIYSALAVASTTPNLWPIFCNHDDSSKGECFVNMLRKMPASFSWDWGPSLPSNGLWKSVEVEGMDVGVIRDVAVITNKIEEESNTFWQLNVTVFADLATATFEGTFNVSSTVLNLVSETGRIAETNADYVFIATRTFKIPEDQISTWWPNGFGDQVLYPLTASLETSSSSENTAKTVRFGFRTVELVQDTLLEDVAGYSFYFKVNGVPIFAKGANWIPGHILPELGADPEMLRSTLLSAKEANMNMLRVWGGGVYESDLFYQIADELGILIWQDMMFASNLYPVGDKFVDSVRIEIEQQVRRLQHHPSLAIWCGNNENEIVLRAFAYDSDIFKANYIKLFVVVIRTIVRQNDPSRPYVTSSPSNGLNTEEQGFIADDPGSAVYGDVHYYNYGSDGWNSETFPDTRFASEYGYQAMPSFLAMAEVSEPSDWTISSNFSQWRNRHDGGFEQMANMMKYHLPLPEDDGSVEYFMKYIYYSQISQAISIKTETEKYRRDRSKLGSDGHGNTMGALYWQLNDVWQCPTWASIEYGGRWKMLHNMAKKFFAPVLVSPEVTLEGAVNVFLVSDLLEPVPELYLDVAVIAYDGFEPKSVITKNVTLSAATSELVWSAPSVNDLITEAGCTMTSCLVKFSLRNETTELSENIYYPSSFSDVTLSPANVNVEVFAFCPTCAILSITADSVAPFVWLETTVRGVFSDNGFTMTTNKMEVLFETRGEILDGAEFLASLTVRDLSEPDPRNVEKNYDNY